MKTIGLSFTKILAERDLDNPGNKAEMNLSFDKLSISDLDFIKKDNPYSLQFTFKMEYKDGEKVQSTISLQGRLVVIFSASELKGIKKDLDIKSIPIELKNILFNIILNKSLTKAVFLADELGLPSPVPIPRATLSEKKD